MATVAITESKTICSVPFLVRKLTCTTGTTAAALTHGGPAAIPDMYWFTNTTANPTASDNSVTATSTTTITVDCEDDGNDTFELWCVWFNASAGGIS